MSSNPEDLTPQARIRAAAVDLFGGQGFDKTTIRQIASRAGVSPGLVIHHYGSKNQLREACDDWAIAVLSSEKEDFLLSGPIPRLDAYVEQHPEFAGITAYFVTALREGGPMAHRIFERLYAMTADMLRTAEEQGVLRPSADRAAQTALLVGMTSGLLMLEHEVAPYLGGTSFSDPAAMPAYGRAALEIFGMFTDDFTAALMAAATPLPEGNE